MAHFRSIIIDGKATITFEPDGDPECIPRMSELLALAALTTVPATPTSTGIAGQKAADAAYDYLARATNIWTRAPRITGWSAAAVPTAGKMFLTLGGSGTWSEHILTLAGDSLFAFDESGNPQTVLKSTFALASALTAHEGRTDNPHGVTPTQLGLDQVANVEQLPLSYLDTDVSLTANSDVKVPSQKAVKAFVSNLLTGKIELIGDLNCGANPNYPAASKGHAYHVTVAGKIGGASGKVVSVGDQVIAKADNAGGTEASVGTSWYVLEGNIPGVTAVGLALVAVTTPAAANYLRINADGTVTSLNLADFKTALALNNVDNTSDATKNAATATLTNKTLSNGTKIVVGSDAAGDMWFRASGGTLERIAPSSTNGWVLTWVAGAPAWAAAAGGGAGVEDTGVYYVNSASGSDTEGDGTAGNPWLSITKALTVAGGDIAISLSTGTHAGPSYNGVLNLKLIGSGAGTVVGDIAAFGGNVTAVNGKHSLSINSITFQQESGAAGTSEPESSGGAGGGGTAGGDSYIRGCTVVTNIYKHGGNGGNGGNGGPAEFGQTGGDGGVGGSSGNLYIIDCEVGASMILRGGVGGNGGEGSTGSGDFVTGAGGSGGNGGDTGTVFIRNSRVGTSEVGNSNVESAAGGTGSGASPGGSNGTEGTHNIQLSWVYAVNPNVATCRGAIISDTFSASEYPPPV